MDLGPENLLAWELYHESRLEGVGALILELRDFELTRWEADELATKLSAVAAAYAEIERDEMKRRQDEADLRRRQSGRRT